MRKGKSRGNRGDYTPYQYIQVIYVYICIYACTYVCMYICVQGLLTSGPNLLYQLLKAKARRVLLVGRQL